VAAVGEDLLRQLAREQRAALREQARVTERGAAENERTRISDDVVSENVVLDVRRDERELCPQRRDGPRRCELGAQRHRRNPVARARRDDVRMPRILVPLRLGELVDVAEVLRVGGVEAPQPLRPGLDSRRVERRRAPERLRALERRERAGRDADVSSSLQRSQRPRSELPTARATQRRQVERRPQAAAVR
jgi:hypothetical protein